MKKNLILPLKLDFLKIRMTLSNYKLTDVGNARRYAQLYSNMVRWDKISGKWITWDGNRWDRNGGEDMAQRYCRGVAIQLCDELKDEPDSDARKRKFKHIIYTESASGIRNLLFVARSEPALTTNITDFDTDPWLFNCLNGTIDLHTGELKPHNPDNLITQLAQVNYIPNETPPEGGWLWERCLSQWHPNEPETLDYLQRLAGICLTGDISARCFPIFWGEGHNGKNIFIEALMGLMGDYAMLAARSLLEACVREEHACEIAELVGKRLVFASEPKKGSKLKVALVKSITGDKELKGRFMHRNFFSFANTTKIIMATQHPPIIEEDTAAIWDRLHRLKWKATFIGASRDTHLGDKLQLERSHILTWAIKGCLKWQKDHQLKPTMAIKKETEQYRNEQNPVNQFIEELFITGLGLSVPSILLERMWANWMLHSDNCSGLSIRDLKKFLRGMGFTSRAKKINNEVIWCWFGLGRRFDS